MNDSVSKMVAALRRYMDEDARAARPTGLPDAVENSDQAVDGKYLNEGVIEPPIQNMVTGSGAGPEIGSRGRGSGRS